MFLKSFTYWRGRCGIMLVLRYVSSFSSVIVTAWKLYKFRLELFDLMKNNEFSSSCLIIFWIFTLHRIQVSDQVDRAWGSFVREVHHQVWCMEFWSFIDWDHNKRKDSLSRYSSRVDMSDWLCNRITTFTQKNKFFTYKLGFFCNFWTIFWR